MSSCGAELQDLLCVKLGTDCQQQADQEAAHEDL